MNSMVIDEQIEIMENNGPFSCADPEGGQGDRTPLENHTNIGFLSNTGLDPLKITKLPSQHSMVGHYRHASVLLAGRCWPTFSGISILSPSHQLKIEVFSVGPPLTKLSGSANDNGPFW